MLGFGVPLFESGWSSGPDGLKHGSVYPFGIDPAWHGSDNELQLMNSIKMKISIVTGIIHMTVGICLSAVNHKTVSLERAIATNVLNHVSTVPRPGRATVRVHSTDAVPLGNVRLHGISYHIQGLAFGYVLPHLTNGVSRPVILGMASLPHRSFRQRSTCLLDLRTIPCFGIKVCCTCFYD